MKPRRGSFQPKWLKQIRRGGHVFTYGQSPTGNWFNIDQHPDGSATIKWEVVRQDVLDELNNPFKRHLLLK